MTMNHYSPKALYSCCKQLRSLSRAVAAKNLARKSQPNMWAPSSGYVIVAHAAFWLAWLLPLLEGFNIEARG